MRLIGFRASFRGYCILHSGGMLRVLEVLDFGYEANQGCRFNLGA